MLMIAAFAFAVFAERMDLHFILGGFLAPIFFVSVGLDLDFSALGSTPGFVVVVILVALFSEFVGAGLPACWVGLSRPEALMVGIGMSGRGAVELIVAGVALQAGLLLQRIVDNRETGPR